MRVWRWLVTLYEDWRYPVYCLDAHNQTYRSRRKITRMDAPPHIKAGF